MADFIIEAPLTVVHQIEDILRERGLTWMNETVAQEGYQNVMIGFCNPGLFSHTLTLKGMPDG